MFTFFRRIRKGLFSFGTIQKYLMYALGEIALVVIGILIALQVNNWNEIRKTKEEARVFIIKIVEDLESDTVNINNIIEYCDSGIEKINAYFSFYTNSQASITVLIDSAWRADHCCIRYFPINNTLHEMQSSGNLRLLNDKQRNLLVDLEKDQEFTQIIVEKMITVYIDHTMEARRCLDLNNYPTDIFKTLGMDQDKMVLINGLLHIHNKNAANISLLRGLKSRLLDIKSKELEIIHQLKNDN